MTHHSTFGDGASEHLGRPRSRYVTWPCVALALGAAAAPQSANGADLATKHKPVTLTVATPVARRAQRSSDYVLALEFRQPVERSASGFIQMTGKKLYHSAKFGTFYVHVARRELKDVFGLDISVATAKGAGNSGGSDAVFLEIRSQKTLKAGLREFLKRVDVIDDPKFGLYDDSKEYRPR